MRSASFTARVAALFLIGSVTFAQPAAKNNQDPKAKTDPKEKTNPKPKAEPEKFYMKMTVSDVRLGTTIFGLKSERDDLKGHVVFVDYWGIHCAPCLAAMPHVSDLQNELADFGLVVIGAHVQDGEKDTVRAVALKHSATFPIWLNTRVSGGDDNNGLPHSFLFDHTGKCIYRGMPTDVDATLRQAVGAALVAGAEREKWSPALQPIVKDLKAGKPPATMLPRVAGLRSASGDVGDDAKALLASMTAVGRKKLEEATAKKESEPLEAFLMVEKVPIAFKGTPLATETNELIGKLKVDKTVKSELAARPALDAVKKIDQQLGLGIDDPRKPDWQKAHKDPLTQLKNKVQTMKRAWPDSKSTQEALAIAERYGVELK
jgi:thiol-disulfide isomerase/thioredoxin